MTAVVWSAAGCSLILDEYNGSPDEPDASRSDASRPSVDSAPIDGPATIVDDPTVKPTCDDDTVALFHLDNAATDECVGGADLDGISVFASAVHDAGFLINNEGETGRRSFDAQVDTDLPFTIEAWVMPPTIDPVGPERRYFVAHLEGRFALAIYSPEGNGMATLEGTLFSGAPCTASTFIIGEFQIRSEFTHVALTYESGEAKLWVNGVAKAVVPIGPICASGPAELAVGSFPGTIGGEAFEHIIDEVRLSEVARTFKPVAN